jgi:hypothetical protein
LNTKFLSASRPWTAIVNTLTHERVHSFGVEHGTDQSRAPNVCDSAYIWGDVAEALLRHREEGQPVRPREDLCPAVHQYLNAQGIVRD